MTKIWTVSLLLVWATPIVGCGEMLPEKVFFGRVDRSIALSSNAQTLAHDNREGAIAMVKELNASQSNVVFSPYAVQTVMAMMYLGAQGDTETDMANAMRWTLDPNALGEAHENLTTVLSTRLTDLPTMILQTASRIWVADDQVLDETYGASLAQHFQAAPVALDFAKNPDKSRQTINAWVKGQTAGAIRDLLPAHSVNHASLVQTAALRLKAHWQVEFEHADDTASFFGAGGVTASPFMYGSNTMNYAVTPDYTAVDVPYDGDVLRLLVVMPQDLPAFIASLDARGLGDAYGSNAERSGNVGYATIHC